MRTSMPALSSLLAKIVSPSFTGAVAEHVHGLANNAGVAHADFVECQEAVRGARQRWTPVRYRSSVMS